MRKRVGTFGSVLAVAGLIALSAAVPAGAVHTLGASVITAASWQADGSLTFSWSDPPLPTDYPGSSWSGGIWTVDAPDGTQECSDYLPSDSSTTTTVNCVATASDSPDGTFTLTIDVQCTCVEDAIGDQS